MLSHSRVVLLFSAFLWRQCVWLCCVSRAEWGASVSVGTLALHHGTYKCPLVGISSLFVFWLVQTWSRLPGGNLLVPHGVLHSGLHRQVRQPKDWFHYSFFICVTLMLLSQSSSQPGQFAAMRSDVREHHGGGRQGELHDRRGGLHGRRKDHRQRPDPLQVCFARISMQSHTLSYHFKKKSIYLCFRYST